MNELCKLQKKLTERKLLKLNKTLLTGHVMLEKSAKNFSGFKFENPTSAVGIAARMLTVTLLRSGLIFQQGSNRLHCSKRSIVTLLFPICQ